MILWFCDLKIFWQGKTWFPLGSNEASDLIISLHHKASFHSRSRGFFCITSLPALNQDHTYFIKKKGALRFLFLFTFNDELAQISVQNGFLLSFCILNYLNFVALRRVKLGTEYAFWAFCHLTWYSIQREYNFFLIRSEITFAEIVFIISNKCMVLSSIGTK